MSFTLKDCKDMALSLMDEYSVDGILISDVDNADYLNRIAMFSNKVQIEIARAIKIPSVFKITQNHIANQLGSMFGFDLVQYNPNIFLGGYTLSAIGSLSYYFEVDNIATITFKENGLVVKTISNAVKGEFTAYKGNLTTGSRSSVITVEFTGLYMFNIRNTALYDVPFPTDSDVPTYKPYCFYDMPSDFMDLDKIIQEGNDEIYRDTQAYFWENKKRLRLGYSEIGSFDVHYWKTPKKIDSSTANDYIFEVDEEAAQLIPFKVASMIIQPEKADISARLLQIYETDLSRLVNIPKITGTKSVQTVFSI